MQTVEYALPVAIQLVERILRHIAPSAKVAGDGSGYVELTAGLASGSYYLRGTSFSPEAVRAAAVAILRNAGMSKASQTQASYFPLPADANGEEMI